MLTKAPEPKASKARYLGTLVARAIVQGDYDTARKLASLPRLGWRVAEARAIAGASRFAQRVYGAPPFQL